jgi:hypothetical protein
MCLFKQPKTQAPPPLAPAPPPPIPPTPATPAPDPVVKDLNPQVRRAKSKSAKKKGSNYAKGTGSQTIKLGPKLNAGMNQGGGLN